MNAAREELPANAFEANFWRYFLMFIWTVPMIAGTITRWADIAAMGWLPYTAAPDWINAVWTSLAILNPLSILLLWLKRPVGAAMMIAIVAASAALSIYTIEEVFRVSLREVWLLLQIVYLAGMVLTLRWLLRLT
ncbi:MAG: hypothetical protein V2J26_08820 [Pacificimonas sp.]|jgi:hypothetical protein|nr:hypothetical protein [Pacificimonas sp.]